MKPLSLDEWQRREDELERRQAKVAAAAIGATYDDALQRAVTEILRDKEPIMPNVYEQLRRSEKADAMAKYCKEHGITAELLSCADDVSWRMLAHHAGVKAPSAETRALVVERMRGVK